MLANMRGWKVAVAGECMLTRTFREHSEPEFLKIKNMLEDADVSYGHLEMNFGDFGDVYPSRGNWVGSFMFADPKIAKDLRWLGLDMMSLAHNHSFDYGPEGVLSTIDACRAAGIVCAGTGRDLDEAREPAYWEGAAGRVALVSTASGNTSNEWANLSKGSMPARPGVNPLRLKMRYHIPEEVADALRTMGAELQILSQCKDGDSASGLEAGEFKLMTTSEHTSCGVGTFVVDDHYGIDSVCHPGDLEGNLRSIREAAKMADLVMVAHHSNSAEDTVRDTPPTYAIEFAHAAIDAGADVYFGHAWHKTLGVEIYRGKPIFYGLGNFFMQSHYVRHLPFDCFDARGMIGGKTAKQSDARPSESPHPGIVQPPRTITLTSALIELEFSPDKQIKTIKFYPVELGLDFEQDGTPINRYTGTRYAEGRPRLVTGKGARCVLERLQTLSKPFGTEILIRGDVGYWEA